MFCLARSLSRSNADGVVADSPLRTNRESGLLFDASKLQSFVLSLQVHHLVYNKQCINNQINIQNTVWIIPGTVFVIFFSKDSVSRTSCTVRGALLNFPFSRTPRCLILLLFIRSSISSDFPLSSSRGKYDLMGYRTWPSFDRNWPFKTWSSSSGPQWLS